MFGDKGYYQNLLSNLFSELHLGLQDNRHPPSSSCLPPMHPTWRPVHNHNTMSLTWHQQMTASNKVKRMGSIATVSGCIRDTRLPQGYALNSRWRWWILHSKDVALPSPSFLYQKTFLILGGSAHALVSLRGWDRSTNVSPTYRDVIMRSLLFPSLLSFFVTHEWHIQVYSDVVYLHVLPYPCRWHQSLRVCTGDPLPGNDFSLNMRKTRCSLCSF